MMGEDKKIQNKIIHYFFWAAVWATIFVAYGSLVPFAYRPYSISEAAQIFMQIPYLSLGVNSRADWVANAIIYFPVGYLWSGYLSAARRAAGMTPLLIVLLIGLAVLIEFAQIFVSPRTVSMNDLLAETIGILLGVGVWRVTKNFILSHLADLVRTHRMSLQAVFYLYGAGFVLLSLFPFDFFVSLAEIKMALAQKGYPLFSHLLGGPVGLKTIAVWGMSFVVLAPLGYLYVRSGPDHRRPLNRIFLEVLVFFTLLEGLQYFVASGESSFFSGLINAGAFLAGAFYATKASLGGLLRHDKWIKVGFYLLAGPFALFALGLRGWSALPKASPDDIRQLWEAIHFMPFYYHYFTTEVHALQSVMAQIILMAPLAGYLVVRDWSETGQPRRGAVSLILWGGATSFVVEAGGMLWSGLKPDPTNVLIGAVGVVALYRIFSLIFNSLTREPLEDVRTDNVTNLPNTAEGKTEMKLKGGGAFVSGPRLIALFSLIGVLVYGIAYPLSQPILLLCGLGYLLLLHYRPSAWLYVIPAAIPLLDLYPLSGRFFMTEFDAAILLTVIFKYGKGQIGTRFLRQDMLWTFLLGALALVYLVSTLRVILPLPDMDLNSFSSYYSVFNSFRIGKGFLWALLLLPVLEYELRRDVLSFIRLSKGMLLGLLAVGLVVLYERQLFTGLLNFSGNAYRITGSFASMHTGGSHIDGYLVTMLPFLAVPFLLQVNMSNIIRYGGLLLLALYTIFVTYSRGPYLISGALAIILAVGLVYSSRGRIKKRAISTITAGLLLMGATWGAVPYFYDTVLSKRLETVAHDRETRFTHWGSSLKDFDGMPLDFLFGHGPGIFPGNLYRELTLQGHRIAHHDLIQEQENIFLRLHSGDNLYTSQFLTLDPSQYYRLRVKVRVGEVGNSAPVKAQITLPLCERWVTDSFRCDWITIKEDVAPGEWTVFQREINMKSFQERISRLDGILSRPVALSFYTSSRQDPVDLDEIEILDSAGNNLIRNGNFQNGKDRWFFAVDNHLLWHTKNLGVNILYDLGLLGGLLIAGLLLLSLVRLIRMMADGEQLAAVFLTALAGFLGVGVVGSLFDVPQLAFLFYFLIGSVMLMWHEYRASLQEGDQAV